jgi:hypothetical protein
MRRAITALAWITSVTVWCAPSFAGGGAAAEFKGYVAIDQVLKDRMIREGALFSLGIYLDDHFSDFGISLVDLLGVYKGGALDSSFHNGQPNVVNMLLWHVAFSGLSHDLGEVCTPSAPKGLLAEGVQDSLKQALKPVCAWPAPEAKSDEALMGLWLALMSFDAPMEEFEAWRDFFRGPEYASARPQDAVADMALAIFSNPHFLLRK